MSDTLRFLHGSKRLSTAIPLKDGSVLQVYPERLSFPKKEKWENHWKEAIKPKISVRATLLNGHKHYTMIYRLYNGKKYISTLLGHQLRAYQVYPSKKIIHTTTLNFLETWMNSWSKQLCEYRVIEGPRYPKDKAPKTFTCPICFLGPGNDHRMCIGRGFRWSKDPVGDWYKACGLRC